MIIHIIHCFEKYKIYFENKINERERERENTTQHISARILKICKDHWYGTYIVIKFKSHSYGIISSFSIYREIKYRQISKII